MSALSETFKKWPRLVSNTTTWVLLGVIVVSSNVHSMHSDMVMENQKKPESVIILNLCQSLAPKWSISLFIMAVKVAQCNRIHLKKETS